MLQDLLSRLADLLNPPATAPVATLPSLDRLIHSARASHVAARRALAVAIAEEERETKRRDALALKTADLERRAIEALRAGRDDLATPASEAIAAIETEIAAASQAALRFGAEVALARREVDAQRRRLADLDRGRRLARVGAALTGAPAAPAMTDSFAAAEATLAQIEADTQDARAIRDELASPADVLIERLSDQGFGAPTRVRGIDVLERLRAVAALPAPLLTSDPSST